MRVFPLRNDPVREVPRVFFHALRGSGVKLDRLTGATEHEELRAEKRLYLGWKEKARRIDGFLVVSRSHCSITLGLEP